MSPCSRPILDLTPPSLKELFLPDGDTSISTAQAFCNRELHNFQDLAVFLPHSNLLALLPSYLCYIVQIRPAGAHINH